MPDSTRVMTRLPFDARLTSQAARTVKRLIKNASPVTPPEGSPRIIPSAAPNEAPDDAPRRSGEAIGFWKTP